ncbi:MAG: DegT/DnrJ/EryC1/StrS family aminotransferase [Melioribacteraceae bacterium]|nr:DegT/DnrJ/EryC1/StrS family aminotransferase [Saprospiraceae bacterium]MCF8356610.1 DegT/DnrJ/EryC1/StrS family aminotransferase [Melioribacteraceae bacterium]MCF8395994.1 DegT/DnrJ/EryC1/StrS family aminotransferase [Melioribacteraceae bacterium]
MRVPLLDLKAQYQSLKKELDEAVIEVAESQYFILGPKVNQLEKDFCEYLGVKHAYGVSSGTDALLIALMAIDIQPGDEVIVPTYSFFATAGVVSRLNAIPVFTDIDPVTMNIDPNDIEHRITGKTKAIIPVHLYGQCADMGPIMEIAKKHNLKVIEDGAQAISSQYKDGRCAGTIGDMGCYSFFPSKNLGGYGDGGLVVTNDDDLAYQLKIKRVHGGDPKYYHKVIGGNFRLDALQAAVIQVKLPHLDSWSQGRRDNAQLYTKLFIEKGLAEEEGNLGFDDKNKVLLPKPVYKEFANSQSGNSQIKNFHIYNQYIIRVEDRDGLREFLKENEIGTEIYYPVSFHQQECFSDLGYKDGDFPHSEFAANRSIALPIYPELTEEQITFVVEKISEYINK